MALKKIQELIAENCYEKADEEFRIYREKKQKKEKIIR